jgi:predicted Zn-dependent peptidase
VKVVLFVAAFLAVAPAVAVAAGGALAVPPVASVTVPAPSVKTVGTATILRQEDDHSPLVGVALVVRAGLDRQTMKQNGLAALVAETILRTPVLASAIPLEDAVAARGGSVRFTVDPYDVRFYVEALAADAPAVIGLVRTALSAPDFSPATVNEARTILVRRITRDQQLALRVGLDMLDAASVREANAGLPQLGTPASLAQLGPSSAQRFYQTYYRRGGAYVSAVGRLDALASGTLVSLAETLPDGTTSAIEVHVPLLQGASHEIIAHRDISSPWLIAEYDAPNISSKDFGAMLVLGAFIRRTLSDIAQVPGVVSPTFASDSVGAVYTYDRAPTRLFLYVNGGIGNPSQAFATALSIVNVLAQTRLVGSIDQFKAQAAGDFVTNATTLESRAWLAAVFAARTSSPDYINRALEAIAATTPQDVQRVARLYLGHPTIALVLPRGAGSFQ